MGFLRLAVLLWASSLVSATAIHVGIKGGSETKIERYPFTVYYKGPGCGGSILNEEWVVTAAHCHMAGSIVYGHEDHTKGKEIGIKQYIPHPGYKYFMTNDIMLLKLDGKIKFSPKARPVRLPKANFEVSTNWQKPVTLIGWGSGSVHENILNKVTVKVVSTPTCQEIFKTRTDVSIHPWHLCVGVKGGGKSECNGDSGGPAVDSLKTLLGVSSWSIKPCGNPNYPGVYTKVSHYISWIHKTTGIKH